MSRLWLIAVAVVLIGSSAGAAELILKNGAKIEAPLLKKGSDGAVLSLGSTILQVPQASIKSLTESSLSKKTNIRTNAYYTAADAPQISVEAGVEKYGDAVVVVRTPVGLGSGFITNKKGYLVTNFHVVHGSTHLTVTQFKKEGAVMHRIIHRDVDIVAVAPFLDLAVLKINDIKDELTTVILAPTDNAGEGEHVFVIGNPMGLSHSVSDGVISQSERYIENRVYHQVNAPINPGNSGGPLFNSHGQVIGVINMAMLRTDGLGFAIPIWNVRYVLDHLESFRYGESAPETGIVYTEPPPHLNRKTTK
jgi:serine protease Do